MSSLGYYQQGNFKTNLPTKFNKENNISQILNYFY
ncbi:hypothetical protein HNQ88_002740 [Aureibacter tunicatorum]|uniref:Uncharacterized protein n=1 Tax=Aureibacter tunicatorum TaxID=866807 RepID=A0AAE3XNF9_9BACT|nr:hypothetical protein [Aureibacter tunicatorum]BDD04168.1 hypothetical protein AUTU_16510 [Aureibacter tunicatorum]